MKKVVKRRFRKSFLESNYFHLLELILLRNTIVIVYCYSSSNLKVSLQINVSDVFVLFPLIPQVILSSFHSPFHFFLFCCICGHSQLLF